MPLSRLGFALLLFSCHDHQDSPGSEGGDIDTDADTDTDTDTDTDSDSDSDSDTDTDTDTDTDSDTDADSDTDTDTGDADGDGFPLPEDCDDTDPTVYPDAPELCDGIANACGDTGFGTSDEDGIVTLFPDVGTPADFTTSATKGSASGVASLSLDVPGTLRFCDGTYYVSVTVAGSFAAMVTSLHGRDTTILDGANEAPPIQIEDADVTVSELTFQNGLGVARSGDLYGAGIDLRGGSALVVDAAFMGGLANKGGAIACSSAASLSISGTTFEANEALDDGGALHLDGCSAVIHDSMFEANTAGFYGGAVYGRDAVVDVVRSLFWTSVSGVNGGAIDLQGGTLAVLESDFVGSTTKGGAIRFYAADGTISSSVFSTNDGGALQLEESTVTIETSYVAENFGTFCGGAAVTSSSTLTCSDSTFHSNDADSGGAVTLLDATSRLESKGCNWGTIADGSDNTPYDILSYTTEYSFGEGETFTCFATACE